MGSNNINKKEESPWERLGNTANKRFKKRKSSRCLQNIFERESLSMHECQSPSSSFFDSSLVSEPPNPLADISNVASESQRIKGISASAGEQSEEAAEGMKLIDWGESDQRKQAQAIFGFDERRIFDTSTSSVPIDWDDTEARSSFESPFVSRQSLNRTINTVYPIDFSNLHEICPQRKKVGHSFGPNVVDERRTSSHLPMDMRLGTKLRLVSDKPFPWLLKINTPGNYEVDESLPDFVPHTAQLLALSELTNQQDKSLIEQNTIPSASTQQSALVSLQNARVYHQFPSIGSVQLFPRRKNANSMSALKTANLQSIEPNFMQSLNQQWVSSLGSLFHSWLADKRTSFYLCSPEFTVLFIRATTKANTSGTPKSAKNKRKQPAAAMAVLQSTPVKVKHSKVGCPAPPSSTSSSSMLMMSPLVGKQWAQFPPTNIPSAAEQEQKKQPQKGLCNSSFDMELESQQSPSTSTIAASSKVHHHRQQQQQQFVSPHKKQQAAGAVQMQNQHLAVVTPTTSGLRQILQQNGIQFSLPFKSDFVKLDLGDSPKDFLALSEDNTMELDHDEWLKDIGVSPKTTLRLKHSASELDAPNISGDSSTGERVPDMKNRLSGGDNSRKGSPANNDSSRSTLLIRGVENLKAFYKLLTSQPPLANTRTGPQAGLPPTLISQYPFRNSTHTELKLSSQLIKKSLFAVFEQMKYVLEVSDGPIMPFVIELLMDFVRQSCSQPNLIQIHLTGRDQCSGINEALKRASEGNAAAEDDGELANFSELEWDGRRFSYIQ